MATTCPHCTAVNRTGAVFCNACGRPLGSGPLPACAVCNAVLRPGSRFCYRCGHKQDTAESVAPAIAPDSAAPEPPPAEPVEVAQLETRFLSCAACGQPNRPEARFCRHCRAALTVACERCGRENRATAKFCLECGALLTEHVPAAPVADPAAPHAGETAPPPRRASEIACEFCGAMLFAGERFCPHCGGSPTTQQRRLLERFATGQIPRGHKLIGSEGAEYLILRLIAQGGMGAVYEVGRMDDGTRWAMKEMSEMAFSRGDRAATVAKFQEEAELLRALRHENLPRVADVFEYNHRHYLVMELIDGQTLGQLLDEADGPLPEKDVVEWGAQLCRVLAFLHTRNPPIIYRDLKPDNIMLDATSGRIKLIDFGIARRFKGDKRSDTLMLGTRGYAAPEQFGKRESDARTDLFALGATLHHLLTHENPGSRRLFEFPPLDGYTHLKLSRRTCEAIKAALDLSPEARPPDAAALFKALTGKTMPAPPPATVPPAAAPGPAVVAGAGAGVPALTGLLGPAAPLDLGTTPRGAVASGSLPVAGAPDTLPVEPLDDWLTATPDVVTPAGGRVTVTAQTGRLALGREDKPVNYRPRFVIDVLWWFILWLYSGHARLIVPAPRRHEGAVRVGQQDIAVAVTVTPTAGQVSTGQLISAAAVALEVTAGVLAALYLLLLL